MRHLLWLFLAPVALWAQTTSFFDTDFGSPLQATRIGSATAPAQVRQASVPLNGQPGPYGAITIQLSVSSSAGGYGGYPYYDTAPAPEAAAWYFFTRPAWQVTPGAGPAITRLEYQEDLLHLSHSCTDCTDSLASFPAIRQGSTVFVARRLNWTTSRGWQSQTLANLTLNDFTEFLRPSGNRLNLGANAPPLEFGFVRGFTATTTTEIQTGIDNFSFTIFRRGSILAQPDTYWFSNISNTENPVSSQFGVLANDGVLEPGSGGYRATLARAPRGELTLFPNGSFTYTIPPGMSFTSDSFEYRLESDTFQSLPTLVNIHLGFGGFRCTLTPVRQDPSRDTDIFNLAGHNLAVELNGAPFHGYLQVKENLFFGGDLDRLQSQQVWLSFALVPFLPLPPIESSRLRLGVGPVDDSDSRCRREFDNRPFAAGGGATTASRRCLLTILSGDLDSSSSEALAPFRNYRDTVLPLQFRDLYYRHSPEMISLLQKHPSLWAQSLQLAQALTASLPVIPAELEQPIVALLTQLRPSMSTALQRDFDATLLALQQPELRRTLGLSVATAELVTRTRRDAAGNTFTIGAIAGDAFLRKTAPDHTVLFERRLGGAGFDAALGLAFGPSGEIYLTGLTQSTDFPVRNAVQPRFGGAGADLLEQGDAFFAAYSPDGQLQRATYLGGADFDIARAIAVDAAGHVYLAGFTRSTDFPLTRPGQTRLRGPADGFVTKLDPRTGVVLYSTYLGGAFLDGIAEILPVGDGELLLAGTMIARLDASGTRTLFSQALPQFPETIATGLLPLPAGEFAVSGYESTAAGLRGWLARYAANGELRQRLPLAAEESFLPTAIQPAANAIEVLGAVLTESSTWEPALLRFSSTLTPLPAPSLPSSPSLGFLTGYDSRGLLTGLPPNPAAAFLPLPPENSPLRILRASTRRRTEELSPGALFVLSGLSQVPGLPAPTAASDGANPPTDLGGLRLRLGEDTYAPLHNLQPDELIFVAPTNTAATTLTVELAGRPLATRAIRWATTVPQLFTANGQPGGPLLGEWLAVEGEPARLGFLAAGLPKDASRTQLLITPRDAASFSLELVSVTPLAGYLGIDWAVTAPLPGAAPKPANATLQLRQADRTSNTATLP